MGQLRSVSFIAVTLTIILLVCFQNCGQQGYAVRETSGRSMASASVSPSNSLEISIPGGAGDTSEGGETWGFNDIVHGTDCSQIKTADISLQIESLSDKATGISLKIMTSPAVITLDSPFIEVSVAQSIEIEKLVVRLVSGASFLMDENEQVYSMAATAQSQQGLEVGIEKKSILVAGKSYKIVFNLDLAQRIAVEGRKCVLKPVLQSAAMIPL